LDGNPNRTHELAEVIRLGIEKLKRNPPAKAKRNSLSQRARLSKERTGDFGIHDYRKSAGDLVLRKSGAKGVIDR
jgi:hypothetical protein